MIIGQDYILVANLEATNIAIADVFIKRPSDLTFTQIPMDSGDFEEAELGFYNIKIKKDYITQGGTYVFRIVGYELDRSFDRECLPAPIGSIVPPDVCIVIGNVRNLSGKIDAFEQIAVEARPLKLPVQMAGTFVMGKNVITYSDYSGMFQLPLIRGMTVLLEIKDVGVRFQTVVPDLDVVRLEDIMPQ